MKNKKMNFEIFIDKNFWNHGEHLVINLNGDLNSAIPTNSEYLDTFKKEKLSEIKYYVSNVNKVKGIELLQ